MRSTSCRNARLDESQAGIKIVWRNINNFRYASDTTLMLESEEELKSFLLTVKEESEEASLKFNIHKTKIMTSSPITSGQIEGEKVEAVTNFIFLGSKITWMVTAAVKLKDNSWRENHDKPRQNIKKQRYHLLTKVCIVKTMFLSGSHVQM